MSDYAVITLSFTRPVYAQELRPDDVFAFPEAPRTPLTVADVKRTVVSPELTLLALTLRGRTEPVNLPASTNVKALRMARVISMTCLLCRGNQDIELDLPRDGEPLSMVCADHVPDLDQPEGQD
ncbi:hypothetical protein ACH40E_39695 [Streptomyces acidicola]|uniref:hypothetical protein n=1 Tax=Streptomyces acidicola TaxID=2596892 RepID=UPI0037892C74